MNNKTIREIAVAWKEYKRPYVKQSTMAAYLLILENHPFLLLEKKTHFQNRVYRVSY